MIFPGNIQATIVKASKTELLVVVPTGAGKGRITVKSLYGPGLSKFYFRDDRNMILDFDNLTAAGGWRAGVMGHSAPASISGNYVRFTGVIPANGGDWTSAEDPFSFDFWPIANGRPKAPLYTGDLTNAELKFECNVTSPWQAGALQMIFTPYLTTGANGYIGDVNVPRGLWMPWQATGSFSTKGWVTVAIPLSTFTYSWYGAICATKLTQDMLYGLTFFVLAGGVNGTSCTPDICIDNIRIVPIQ